nr:SNF2-related protein [Actinomadura sp. NBRC 104425]
MDDLGLGAVVADSMGLGKCVHPDELVFANGALVKARDIWARFAGAAVSDGEGEWATPLEPLTVNSIDEKGRIVPAKVTRLYRQHVREPLRKVRLDDGSEITVTRRHRLLGPEGWTRELAPGQGICVPSRLVHDGLPLDADLTVLLAWQISEGRETVHNTAFISQKNEQTLHDLAERLRRVGARFGLDVSRAQVVSAAPRTPHLEVTSKDYRRFLEELGYTWARNSAHKRIPDAVMAADDRTVALFLRHYFAAEVSVGEGMRGLEIASASGFVIRQLAAMLRRFGIWLRRTVRWKHATDGRRIRRPYHVGLIGGPSLHLFRERIGIADPVKAAKLSAVCAIPSDTNVEGVPGAERDRLDGRVSREVFYATVTSVEDVDYEGYVYDLEVADHHNYVAEGMLCHNTAQTLALLVHERGDGRGDGEGAPGPTLLVVPMSLVGNWQREAAKFAPKLRVYVHHGTGRHRDDDLVRAAAQADLVVTTYGTAARDAAMLARVAWERVVCDEAQALKNSGTRQARAIRGIPARTRIALTGTPVENHLMELWSILEFANPGLLGPRAAFRERFAVPIERDGDEAAALALRRATRPFVLRRLKTDKAIISDLPEKQEIKVYCNLTAEQASLYQATLDDMLARIAESEEDQRRGLVLATMARLKQVCNHPAQLLGDGSRLPGRSGKLERLEEICAQVVEQGEKALVFTQYAEFGAMLRPYLAARLERPVLWLHGGTSRRQRDELVRRFQEDAEPAVFLLSLKAAGTGLTLTAANHVVHVDRWWNPAVEDQATDRAFRIGQTKNVQVRKLICVGTLEERIDEMIDRKKALAESVVGSGEDWLTELSVAELREVLRLSPEAVSG